MVNADLRVDSLLVDGILKQTLPKELLIVGPAGTGKTRGILNTIHLLCRDNPGLRVLMARQTRVSMSDSVLVTYEQEVLAEDSMQSVARGASRRGRTGYAYPSGSEIVLMGLDEPARAYSTAWDLIYINEAIEVLDEAWDTLGTRLDRPGRSLALGYLIGDTNPGDPSHWLRKRIDAKRLVHWPTSHKANPAMWQDGRWTKAGLAYIARLDRLTGTRRKRFKEGLWAAGEGQWFESFSDQHISVKAAYHPSAPVYLAVDSGVHTAAVWFQIRQGKDGPIITVFGDYYAFNVPAYDVALQILARTAQLCKGRFDVGLTDPAGNSSTPIGPTVSDEYRRAGLKLDYWPSYSGSVVSGLTLIESFVSCSPPALLVSPDCQHLINAMANYKRAKRSNQYIDRPVDPQHPYEDVMDALRGGLQHKFPEGRRPGPGLVYIPGRNVF